MDTTITFPKPTQVTTPAALDSKEYDPSETSPNNPKAITGIESNTTTDFLPKHLPNMVGFWV